MQLFQFPIPEIVPAAVLPLAIVAFTGILALIIEMLAPNRNNNAIVIASLVGLGAAAVSLFSLVGGSQYETAGGALYVDPLSSSLQLLIVLSTALAILFSEPYLRTRKIPFGEFYPLVLWSATGAMILATTKNLLMVFLGVEILSIALYVMAGMGRTDEKSGESALKYFLLGAFASGFLLYGIAFLYGATGSLQLDMIRLAWTAGTAEIKTLLLFGLGLVLVGLSFKASFVPFHQWTPDVYQGAPTNVTAYMASVSKIGAFAALYRLLEASSAFSEFWILPVSVIAALTMIVGNIAAVTQSDLKRLLGYSSVGHAGYVLVALIAHGKNPSAIGPDTVVYYLLGYVLTTIGAFAVISLTAREDGEVTELSALRGLWQRSPLAAATLVIAAFSLMGFPLTAGFFGKWFVFQDAIKAGLVPLAVVLAVASAISVFYYLKIAQAVFSSDADENTHVGPLRPVVALTCVLCAAGVVLAGVFVAPFSKGLGLSGTSTAGAEAPVVSKR